MYQYVDGNLAISTNDWFAAGLTYNQFREDRRDGLLDIARKGKKGETLILMDSIARDSRRKAIEKVLGEIPKDNIPAYRFELDAEARRFYESYETENGVKLGEAQVTSCTYRASLFESMKRGLEMQMRERERAGIKGKIKIGDWYTKMLVWHTQKAVDLNVKQYSNVRSFERAFKAYCKDGYKALIHGHTGGENARRVSLPIANLLLALWRTHDKPFVSRVHELYIEFISGVTELYDTETGEVFRPEDFMKDGKAPELSVATVWNYLKDAVNSTAVYADRNGHFDYANSLRPKQHRKTGRYSLSKISMDDVALSRKSNRGWVYKYIAVDVVSGYYFRPAYVVGKPTLQTVYEAFRNMFCELMELGLPMPGELEVEHHLMKDITWLSELFPIVRFCQSPTEKRAEHNIRSLKWGAAKDAGHTRGRWYAKHEAYRCVRNKVDGDYIDPVYQAQTIVADDLADIEQHNNSLHPLQKMYPGMTRRDVLIKNANPNLQRISPHTLLRYIGNETPTSIRNNDWCAVANGQFELTDFSSLRRLKPNNYKVTAYWLPENDGSIERVYLYQGEVYIGEAVNRAQYSYNECAIERTAEDEAKMLHQHRRNAKFDKMIRERRASLPKIGRISAEDAEQTASLTAEIIETEQPAGYEEDEWTSEDYAAIAIKNL